MKRFLLLIPIMFMCGCSTIQEQATEPNARTAAEWVRNRSGFIESAVMTITHLAVYSAEKDSGDRQRTLEIMRAVAGNLNTLIVTGDVDPDSIANALRIDEPYFGPLFDSVANLIHVELLKSKENGYADLTIEVLRAVTKGISDGATE